MITLIKKYPRISALIFMLAVATPLMLSPLGALALSPIGAERLMVMDGLFCYSAEYVSYIFERLGPDGRLLYLIFHMFDCLFALSYALLMRTLIKPLAKARWQWLVLPVLPAAFDVIENILIQVMSAQFPAISPMLAQTTSVVTSLKWLGFLVFVAAFVVLLVQKRRRKP